MNVPTDDPNETEEEDDWAEEDEDEICDVTPTTAYE